MIIPGTKAHVVYRALYEKSVRRHFLGEVTVAEGAACLLEGYAFVWDEHKATFTRKPEKRTTVIDLAESGYIVNLLDDDLVLENVEYRYLKDVGLVATDGANFMLNINEFGSKS